MFEIIQVSSQSQLFSIRESLINLYQEVFAEPPEYQVWSQSELDRIFTDYCDHGYFFVAVDGLIPVGFCAIIPFTSSKVCLSQVTDGLFTHTINEDFLRNRFDINAFEILYIADLVIDPRYRRQGLASQLMKTATSSRKPTILRVSLCRKSAIALYEKLGFQPLNLFQTAQYKQLNGQVKTFEKMLMILT